MTITFTNARLINPDTGEDALGSLTVEAGGSLRSMRNRRAR